ncbi:hypothetical protein CSUI_000323 [Cystoisospora suis]|uniref:SRS domain-containing protein n=1 Tax=Cystoisospora suis TaxID=483139 RepID=A0A2C6KPB2_9APIC|nr:hypothetical protein CSUI_000323 [Cystoisospora suis]
MKLHLTSIGVAVAAVALSGESTVPSVRAVDASATAPVECNTGEKTLDIKAANDSVSFKCAKTLSLDPAFAADAATKAYQSASSTQSVLLSEIVPKAKLTQTDIPTVPATKVNGGDNAKEYSYQLNVPELPPETKTVVFKCREKAASENQAMQQETPKTTCTVIINVAKSAASIAATPLAAAGSIALAVLASVVAQAL